MVGNTGGENSLEVTGKPAFQTLAVNIPLIVYRVYMRERNRMEFFNDMLERMTGYKSDELRSGELCSIDPMIISEDLTHVLEVVNGALRENKPFEVEYRITHKNGGIRYFLESGQLIDGSDGKPEFIDGVILDITDRKCSEMALSETEERFRSVLENSLDAIYRWNLKTSRFDYISPSFGQVTGFTPDELKAMGIDKALECVHPDDRHYIAEGIENISKCGKGLLEYRFMAKNGEYRWLAVSLSVVKDKEGSPSYHVGVIRDITPSKQTEKTLLFKEHIIESSSSVIATCDLEGNMTYGNPSFLKAWGFDDPEEFIGRPFWEFWLVKDRLDEIMQALRHDGTWFGEIKAKRKDGGIFDVRVSAATVFDSGGNPIALTSTSTDITERKRAEEALQAARDELELRVRERTADLAETNVTLREEVEKRKRYEEQLRGSTQKILQEVKRRRVLSQRLVETLEMDRRDVAMYLHDQVGQMLVTLRMDLEEARKATEGARNKKIGKAEDKVLNIMNHIKDISRKLRPDILDTLGLVPALRSLIEFFKEEYGLRVHFYYREPSQEIDLTKSLASYRITQEALNNVAKHAQATEVFVNLIIKNHSIQLSVEDDGIGFNYQDMKKSPGGADSLGIMIMRERANLVGGDLSMESEIGKGTHVVAEIPID
jgi:PAS domain S-box-containing protein